MNEFERYWTTSVDQRAIQPRQMVRNRKELRKHLGRLLPKRTDAPVCEIGCGFGRNVRALLELGYTNVTGVDISPEQVKMGREVLGLTCLQVADGLEWLKSGRSYECILLLDVLEHFDVSGGTALLCAAYQALAPGGRLIVRVPNLASPFAAYYHGDVTHKMGLTKTSIAQVFRMAGIVEDMEVIPTPPVCNCPGNCVRKIAWHGLINPVLWILTTIIYGRRFAGVHTPNLIGTVVKRR